MVDDPATPTNAKSTGKGAVPDAPKADRTDSKDVQLKKSVDRLLKYMPLMAAGHFLVGIPALIVSLSVAYFSFVQAEATDKMQVASVWPRVAYETANRGAEGQDAVTLSLANKGVGPAIVRGMKIEYEGREFAGFRELLSECCSSSPETLAVVISGINGEVLRPGEQAVFAQLIPRAGQIEAYEAFETERLKLAVSVCYCSVFEDCWVQTTSTAEPAPVQECPADWKQYTGFDPQMAIEP